MHSSFIAWKIPWTVEPGGLTVHGITRVGHDLVTKSSPSGLLLGDLQKQNQYWVCVCREILRSNPFQYSCLGNRMDQGAWQAIAREVTKS